MAEYRTRKTKHAVYNTLRCLGGVLFGERRFKQPKFLEHAAQKDKYEMWLAMIDAGKINEAENELIAELEHASEGDVDCRGQKMELLEVALQVYQYINDKEDEFLEMHCYSREEVEEGIRNALQMMGMHNDLLL